MLRSKIISNLFWRFAERSGAQLVAFAVSVILARVLGPDAYGTVALITVFTTILQVFVDSGLGNALIQKKNADDCDFSTVFFTNIVFCIILYVGIFFAAPLIAGFYEDNTLVPYIRVLGLTILVSGIKNVQQAYVSRHLMFKKFFFSTLSGTIIAAAVGIVLAFNGFGVWALVVQQVINVSVDTLVLWITVKWHPKAMFSFERLKGLLSYGWKLLASTLLDTVYNDVRQLVIGKLYTSENLAFYNQGEKFPKLIVNNVNNSIDSVLLPIMSKEQDHRQKVKEFTRYSVMMSTFIMAPMMMGLASAAPALVELILKEKWLPCVPFLRIFCITYMFYPIHTANLNAIKAMGRSDLSLKIEIVKKIVDTLLLLSTMWFGVMAMAYGLIVSSFLSQIINSYPNKKLLGYRYIDQLKDILPSIIIAVVMGLIVSLVAFLNLPVILTLAVQVLLGVIIYVGAVSLLKLESYCYIKDKLVKFLKK